VNRKGDLKMKDRIDGISGVKHFWYISGVVISGVGPNQLPGKPALSYENGLILASISLFSTSKRAL